MGDLEVVKLREKLRSLLKALKRYQHHDYSIRIIEEALSSSDDELLVFLKSNLLWGGSGSIADQAGFDASGKVRKEIELAIRELGLEQLETGIVNERTEFWVSSKKKYLETRRND
ncbi:MAG: hypothetical protein DWQ47_04770 [Acidobacteria bacterium]|nr:MAG: hypothetical protein DWQ32_08320 [Acidobacteriota bacterium]REK01699.1 MAG: hypothetical protein DWQ38_04755 [Acidobacteriota bacterium]REK14655.1 MAG: hypothetical protein DWQ43_14010 [Acidobacteriota bacterium]REK45370.1 MAG: hypothetical protein DWQ47_04770 [Acidobacteriota bacterium]